MKKSLIILLAFVTLSATAQPGSEWRKARNIKWGKTALNIGASLLSVGLELSGDALYDMGKESGNVKQMQWGHTLQATGYVVPLFAIPFLVKDSPNKWIKDAAIIVGTYGLMRFATADMDYNAVSGRPLLDVGTVTKYDQFMSKVPPDGRVVYKTFSFTLGFVLNINYW